MKLPLAFSVRRYNKTNSHLFIRFCLTHYVPLLFVRKISLVPERVNKEKDLEIINQIRVQIRNSASVPYEQTLNNINWRLVSMPGYSPSEIKDHFFDILRKQPLYRLLFEIVNEIETKYMSKFGIPEESTTLNAFTLFCKENKDLIQINLSSGHNMDDFIITASKLYKELTWYKRNSYREKTKLMKKSEDAENSTVESGKIDNYESKIANKLINKKFVLRSPPNSIFKYYVQNVFKGPKSRAKPTYKSLNINKKAAIRRAYSHIKKQYVADLKAYARTLSPKKFEELKDRLHNIMYKLGKWNKEKDLEIVKQIRHQYQIYNPVPYKQNLENINWQLISINGHTSSKIKRHFYQIVGKQRSYRLLTEILDDIESVPVLILKQLEQYEKSTVESEETDEYEFEQAQAIVNSQTEENVTITDESMCEKRKRSSEKEVKPLSKRSKIAEKPLK